jgi:hypothetical protein
MHSYAQPDGTQKSEDAGSLTKKRMETICVSVPTQSRRAAARPGVGTANTPTP